MNDNEDYVDLGTCQRLVRKVICFEHMLILLMLLALESVYAQPDIANELLGLKHSSRQLFYIEFSSILFSLPYKKWLAHGFINGEVHQNLH